MFLDGLIRLIRAPGEMIRSKIWQAKSVPQGMRYDAQNLKAALQQSGNDLRGGAQSARGFAGQGAAAVAPQPGQPGRKPRRMGLFSRKRKCAGCGQKLHASWDQCPYCGMSGAQPVAGAQPMAGGKPRTMALDMGAARGGGGVSLGWIVPIEGAQGGEVLPLKGRCVVGTGAECDVVMKDPSISSRHAEFAPGPSGFRVNDLGSTNGTFVNDKRVTSEDLVDGDMVRLGRTNCKFKSMS